MSTNAKRLLVLFTFLLFSGASCVRISGGNGSTVGAAYYRSDDGGGKWLPKESMGQVTVKKKVKSLSINGYSITDLKFSRANPALLVISTDNNGLFTSMNRGDLWQVTGYKSIVYDFDLDPLNPQIMFVTGGATIRKTIDGGKTWAVVFTVTKTGETVRTVGVDFYNPQRVLAASNTGMIYLSVDGGTSWTVLTKLKDSLSSLLFNPNDSRIIFLKGDDQILWRSTDAGKTWQSLKKTFKPFSKSVNRQHYSFTGPGQRTLYLGSAYGVLRSNDNGDTWQTFNTLLPALTAVTGIVADPDNEQIISLLAAGKLHRTSNGGADWTVTSVPAPRPISFLRADPTSPNTLYIGTRIPPKKK